MIIQLWIISYKVIEANSYFPFLSSSPNSYSSVFRFLHVVRVQRWRRQWHPTPILLSGKSHGRRSLIGCSPWSREESDTTERLHSHFSLSCIGEGHGNPLQCSCLENPRDGGAWPAAVYGVAQSRTRLKWLSSSSMVGDSVLKTSLILPCRSHKRSISKYFSFPMIIKFVHSVPGFFLSYGWWRSVEMRVYTVQSRLVWFWKRD